MHIGPNVHVSSCKGRARFPIERVKVSEEWIFVLGIWGFGISKVEGLADRSGRRKAWMGDASVGSVLRGAYESLKIWRIRSKAESMCERNASDARIVDLSPASKPTSIEHTNRTDIPFDYHLHTIPSVPSNRSHVNVVLLGRTRLSVCEISTMTDFPRLRHLIQRNIHPHVSPFPFPWPFNNQLASSIRVNLKDSSRQLDRRFSLPFS